jgi:hypothetical protein
MGFISKIKLKEVRSLMSVEDREISLWFSLGVIDKLKVSHWIPLEMTDIPMIFNGVKK